MSRFVCLRSVAEVPNDQGRYEVEKWCDDAPCSSGSLNEPFAYDELDETLEAAKTDAQFAYCVQVTDTVVDEEGYISVSLDKEFTLETEDIRDRIITPTKVWPKEVEYYIIADNDEEYLWVVVYPSR